MLFLHHRALLRPVRTFHNNNHSSNSRLNHSSDHTLVARSSNHRLIRLETKVERPVLLLISKMVMVGGVVTDAVAGAAEGVEECLELMVLKASFSFSSSALSSNASFWTSNQSPNSSFTRIPSCSSFVHYSFPQLIPTLHTTGTNQDYDGPSTTWLLSNFFFQHHNFVKPLLMKRVSTPVSNPPPNPIHRTLSTHPRARHSPFLSA
jgi:hypothetical protein